MGKSCVSSLQVQSMGQHSCKSSLLLHRLRLHRHCRAECLRSLRAGPLVCARRNVYSHDLELAATEGNSHRVGFGTHAQLSIFCFSALGFVVCRTRLYKLVPPVSIGLSS